MSFGDGAPNRGHTGGMGWLPKRSGFRGPAYDPIWDLTTGQRDPEDLPVCEAIHWHIGHWSVGGGHDARSILSTRQVFLCRAYDHGRGFAPPRVWFRVDDVAIATTQGALTVLAVRRDGPPTVSRGQLPFWAVLMAWREPGCGKFFAELAQRLPSGRVIPVWDGPPLAQHRREVELLRELLPLGTPDLDELEAGQARVEGFPDNML